MNRIGISLFLTVVLIFEPLNILGASLPAQNSSEDASAEREVYDSNTMENLGKAWEIWETEEKPGEEAMPGKEATLGEEATSGEEAASGEKAMSDKKVTSGEEQRSDKEERLNKEGTSAKEETSDKKETSDKENKSDKEENPSEGVQSGEEEKERTQPVIPESAIQTEAPSVTLLEVSTGQILYEKNAQEQRSPASITKIMTLLLIFEELEKGTLKLDDEVVTSAYAKSMGGSQVYLEEGEKQTVETLIKCIVVASGNDASVAMAEHIAGSEAEFVQRMNERAAELGMVHTHFEDCCGLTDSSNHYTCASDVAIMSRELLSRFPQITDYSSIWMETITHVTAQGTSEFGLTNTNKLVRSYEGCVGLKTGSTSVAKYCVSAAAQRNDIMLLAVVMGAPDPKVRFQDAAALLNYGFGICNLYKDENQDLLAPAKLEKGKEDQITCQYDGPFYYLDTQGLNLSQVQKTIEYTENLKAPVKKGDVVGKANYLIDGTVIGSVDIVSTQDAEAANIWDYLKKAARKLLHRNS